MYGGAFFENNYRIKAVNYSCKNVHDKYLTWSQKMLLLFIVNVESHLLRKFLMENFISCARPFAKLK